jgi:ATP phosphoribosyltransferase regulatory subunit
MTGRTPSEIAARHTEKAALAAGVGARAAAALTRFLAIGGSAEAAGVALRELARDEGLRVAPSLDRFAARLDAFAARGVALDRLTFAADFGRRLDYYTGFVFEMYATRRAPRPVIGGGRYDRLVSLLARLRHETAVTVPAIGFSLWLDRVGGQG